jgi:hypothetical protein
LAIGALIIAVLIGTGKIDIGTREGITYAVIGGIIVAAVLSFVGGVNIWHSD